MANLLECFLKLAKVYSHSFPSICDCPDVIFILIGIIVVVYSVMMDVG